MGCGRGDLLHFQTSLHKTPKQGVNGSKHLLLLHAQKYQIKGLCGPDTDLAQHRFDREMDRSKPRVVCHQLYEIHFTELDLVPDQKPDIQGSIQQPKHQSLVRPEPPQGF